MPDLHHFHAYTIDGDNLTPSLNTAIAHYTHRHGRPPAAVLLHPSRIPNPWPPTWPPPRADLRLNRALIGLPPPAAELDPEQLTLFT